MIFQTSYYSLLVSLKYHLLYIPRNHCYVDELVLHLQSTFWALYILNDLRQFLKVTTWFERAYVDENNGSKVEIAFTRAVIY